MPGRYRKLSDACGERTIPAMTAEAAPTALYETIEPEEAGSVTSGRIEIAPEIVESALDRIAESDDASFPRGGPLDQAVERDNEATSGDREPPVKAAEEK